MKTNSLLLAVALLFGVAIHTQANDNLIVNGNFEEEVVYKFDFDGDICPALVPGWDAINTPDSPDFNDTDFNNQFSLNRWNIYPIIEDAYFGRFAEQVNNTLIDDENMFCLVLKRYEWNGWGEGGLQQTVAVEAGETYDFSFLCAGMWDELRQNNDGWTGEFERSVEIYEDRVDESTLIYSYMMDPEEQRTFWYEVKDEIRASDSANSFIIRLKINNNGGEDSEGSNKGSNQNAVALFDNIKLTPKNGNNIEKINGSNISIVKSGAELIIKDAAINNKVSLFDITGKEMTSGIIDSATYGITVNGYLPGVYIVKIGNESFKVIL